MLGSITDEAKISFPFTIRKDSGGNRPGDLPNLPIVHTVPNSRFDAPGTLNARDGYATDVVDHGTLSITPFHEKKTFCLGRKSSSGDFKCLESNVTRRPLSHLRMISSP